MEFTAGRQKIPRASFTIPSALILTSTRDWNPTPTPKGARDSTPMQWWTERTCQTFVGGGQGKGGVRVCECVCCGEEDEAQFTVYI